jgi:putative ABC transport system permease protein
MIQLVDVSKTYRVKKGPEVKALDHVNITFGERGLVFILGKSGAGKSTMLNIIGGLDRIDSGDIVIMGKSSKDFTQAEFDSYRNTYLGFIFQEYNILKEFSVGQNIALAMQLQGLKGERSEVEAILKEVDLDGLYDRKPNELSGGQKQRVAIARALIKKPEIIMADEPTGALDSKTGQDIFNTLKKLAETHLVIVVSHDREFAENFGDRVIEMKDGKVISDITKTYQAKAENNGGVSVLSKSLLQFEPGHVLSAEDIHLLNSYFARAEKPAMVSIDSSLNAELKSAAKIDESGRQGTFKDTTAESVGAKTYNAWEFQLKKSRLPFARSFKMAVNSLRSKPFRLVLTCLLSLISFGAFGIAASIAGYDSEAAFNQCFSTINVTSLTLGKNYSYKGQSAAEYFKVSHFSDQEMSDLNQKYSLNFKPGQVSVGTFTAFGNNGKTLGNSNTSYTNSGSTNYIDNYLYNINDLVYAQNPILASDGDLSSVGCTLLEGHYPSAKNEVALSSYYVEIAKRYGWGWMVPTEVDDGKGGTITVLQNGGIKAGTVTSASSFLAAKPVYQLFVSYMNEKKEYVSEHVDFSVVGLVDSGIDLTPFAKLDGAYDDVQTADNSSLMSQLRNLKQSSYFTATFGPTDFYKTLCSLVDVTFTQDMPIYSSLRLAVNSKDPVQVSHIHQLVEDNKPATKTDYTPYQMSEVNDRQGDPQYKNNYFAQTALGGYNFVQSFAKEMGVVFFWVGFVTACFAALLLGTFIASSIAYQKREIGILRALGARGADIYGIFWNEATLISLGSAFLGVVLTGILDVVLSNKIIESIGIPVSVFRFAFWVPLLVLAIALATGTIASFIPCLVISKKKPIDSINDK